MNIEKGGKLLMLNEMNLTGYPSIDKPWLKYYSKEAIDAPLPEMTMYQYLWANNKGDLSDVALRYYGIKITYGELFDNIEKTAKAFYAIGIRSGDIVTIMSAHTGNDLVAICTQLSGRSGKHGLHDAFGA